MRKLKHVHFMGIGGSGSAGVAVLAKSQGFGVSGCDQAQDSYYLKSLAKVGIKPQVDHNASHLKKVDILAISPAVLEVNSNHPEIKIAQKRGILMTWQRFMGLYLQKNKFVIAIAGTHGKSTVTALAGLVLEEAGLDPLVEVGAIVSDWQAGARTGHSKYFVCEADEFNENFLNYFPSIIIINNIEMDHPEFFKNFAQFRKAFQKFVWQIHEPKILIVNEESRGIQELLRETGKWLKENKVKVIGYFLKKKFSFTFNHEYQGRVDEFGREKTRFTVMDAVGQRQFQLKIPGLHNVANSLGVIALADFLKIKPEKINRAFSKFSGIGRRFDLVGKASGVKVFDDYAVHPTAIKATLNAAKQKYPQAKIWAVYEPHQFSRLYLFLNDFAEALSLATWVIVAKIFAGREKDSGKVKAEDLVEKIGTKAIYLENFEKIANAVAQKAKKGEIVIVFGAGKSYLISKMIVEKLKK